MVLALIALIGAALHGDTLPTDRYCATVAVYGEARGESELGQAMVARVIQNRVTDSRWPGTACAVVAQRAQFAGYYAGLKAKRDPVVWRNAAAVVDAVFDGKFSPGRCGHATHFHNTSEGTPAWARSKRMQRLCRVDNHIFYLEHAP